MQESTQQNNLNGKPPYVYWYPAYSRRRLLKKLIEELESSKPKERIKK